VKKKKMKKIGMILAALVITLFFVNAVAAMPAQNPPDQREKFREDSAVQGIGYIEYDKKILDKAIAVDVEEHMKGQTGENGSFAMTITEILDEGVRLNCSGNCDDMGTLIDPIYGNANSPVMTNFECKKMIQFEGDALVGEARYNNPGFQGGINAEVTENYEVFQLQKDETVMMTTTATYNNTDRDWSGCKEATPYNANELNYDSKNAFIGNWGTDSTWKKVFTKDVTHHQFFSGEFQVDKNLIFKEEVTEPCPGKDHIVGDC
jgi:hypothetical protein